MKTSIKMSTVLLTSGIILSTLLTACDSADITDKVASAATEAAVEKMSDSEMDISIDNDEKNQQQTIVMKEGDDELKMVVGLDVALPKDFPSDVPLPASMRLISATEIPDQGYSIHGAVAGELSTTISQTKIQAKDAGWEESTVSEQLELIMIIMEKDGRVLVYSVMELEPKERQVEGHNLMYSVTAS